jgi:hypothetical protein
MTGIVNDNLAFTAFDLLTLDDKFLWEVSRISPVNVLVLYGRMVESKITLLNAVVVVGCARLMPVILKALAGIAPGPFQANWTFTLV